MNLKYKIKKEINKFKSLKHNEKYSKELYKQVFNKDLDLNNPVGFNEKLMLLKIKNYNNNQLVTNCSDRYLFRLFVIGRGIKEKHLPKLIKKYNYAFEMNFKDLPNKFILKLSNFYGYDYICQDKNKIEKKKLKQEIFNHQKEKYGIGSGELYFTRIKPKIIIEELEILNDIEYKIYCFNGRPKVILAKIAKKLKFYDLNWNEIFICKDIYYNQDVLKKPRYLKEMLGMSKKLAKEFPFVRIGFKENDEKVLVEEMSFTPGACLADYYTEDGNKYLGKLLDIKNIREN